MVCRTGLLLAVLAISPALSGCLVAGAADAVGTVAFVGVKTGAKVAGATVGVAADGVGAVGHAVTGTGKKRASAKARTDRAAAPLV